MRISHDKAILFSGAIWFAIGIMLLSKGLNFLMLSTQNGTSQQLVILLIAAGLLIGFFKGKFVLAKTVKRVVESIRAKSNPFPMKTLYPRSYYLIILSMMLLGLSMRWLPVPLVLRGIVDVAVGSALMNGAVLYFRSAFKKAPAK